MNHYNGYQNQVSSNDYTVALHFDGDCVSLTETVVVCFDVCPNDEQISLCLKIDQQAVELGPEHQHYPLLLLARQRMICQSIGYAEQDCGWIDSDEFGQMLRCSHGDILQFIKCYSQSLQSPCFQHTTIPALVQRRGQRIRFGHENIHIRCDGSDYQL